MPTNADPCRQMRTRAHQLTGAEMRRSQADLDFAEIWQASYSMPRMEKGKEGEEVPRLVEAAERGNVEKLRRLLEAGASIDERDKVSGGGGSVCGESRGLGEVMGGVLEGRRGLLEQQPPQGVLVCDHAGLVINKFSLGGYGPKEGEAGLRGLDMLLPGRGLAARRHGWGCKDNHNTSKRAPLPFPRRWGCSHLRLLPLRTCSV